eukprot:1158243-Pelagomonas_calceolata.AAC.7
MGAGSTSASSSSGQIDGMSRMLHSMSDAQLANLLAAYGALRCVVCMRHGVYVCLCARAARSASSKGLEDYKYSASAQDDLQRQTQSLSETHLWSGTMWEPTVEIHLGIGTPLIEGKHCGIPSPKALVTQSEASAVRIFYPKTMVVGLLWSAALFIQPEASTVLTSHACHYLHQAAQSGVTFLLNLASRVRPAD